MQTQSHNELECELNRLWIAKCKANDEFLECIAKLDGLGYTISWSDEIEKQFEIHKKGATMQKQSYEQVFEDLKKIDYEVLVKAMFLFGRDDLLKLNKETRDDILGSAYNFYLKCDLGCFVDERLLDELDGFKNEIVGENDDE